MDAAESFKLEFDELLPPNFKATAAEMSEEVAAFAPGIVAASDATTPNFNRSAAEISDNVEAYAPGFDSGTSSDLSEEEFSLDLLILPSTLLEELPPNFKRSAAERSESEALTAPGIVMVAVAIVSGGDFKTPLPFNLCLFLDFFVALSSDAEKEYAPGRWICSDVLW